MNHNERSKGQDTKYILCPCPICNSEGKVLLSSEEESIFITIDCRFCSSVGRLQVKYNEQNEVIVNGLEDIKEGYGAYYVDAGSHKSIVKFYNRMPSIADYKDFLFTLKRVSKENKKKSYFYIWHDNKLMKLYPLGEGESI